MSVFIPVDKELYQVTHWYTDESENMMVVATPSPITNSIESLSVQRKKEANLMKPKIVKVIRKEKKNEKKFWTLEEKIFAIRKAQTIGISKALRFLQNEYSDVYSELSPSTIQYWVSKCKHLVQNVN